MLDLAQLKLLAVIQINIWIQNKIEGFFTAAK